MIYFTTFKVALVLHLKTADFTFSPSYETRLNYITGDPRHLHNSPLDDAFLASTSSVAGFYALSATFFLMRSTTRALGLISLIRGGVISLMIK